MRHPKHKAILIVLALSSSLFLLFFHLFMMPKQLFTSPTSTVILDDRGGLLSARIASDGQWRFPEADSLDERLVSCIVQYEDRRFYRHFGIDPIAICRAVKRNLTSHSVKEGASTITMQLARLARGNQPRTLKNKIIEVFWAVDMEFCYSKKDILRLYLSHAPFGGNVVGIDAAAWRYFNRDVSCLSWAELCCLAVLPNSPALIHPGRNRMSLKHKRDGLLRSLHKAGVLTAEQFALSVDEPLPEKPYPIPNKTPHLLDYLSKNQQGKTVHTSIHMRLQTLLQRLANDYCDKYRTSNHIENIAILVLDVQSGMPIAYVGNTTDKCSEAWQVDVIQSERSPGSTLKPFLYAAMLSGGEITPWRLISDTPLTINGFTPSNFSHSFSGAVHADEAVVQSLNVPLVRMVSRHSPGRFMADLKWLGMSTLHYNEDHYGVSIILGGAEVKLWDLCGMYRNLAFRLLSSEHEEVDCRISKPAIWYTFLAMSKLNRPEEEAEWMHFRSMKNIAWKTGTSWGSRDAWSVGVNPKYVVGVWVGNATGEGRSGMTGVGFASPVMFDVFALLEDVPWFDMPKGMTPMVVCRKSGCLASDICALKDTVLLPSACAHTENCHYCHLVHLSADGKWRVNASCEEVDAMQTKSWFSLPAAQEYYYKKHHADYYPLPPYRDDCLGFSDTPEFIYPTHNAVIIVPRGFDGTPEHVVFKAACKRSDAVLYWHLDDRYIGKSEHDHQIKHIPSKGDHTISIVDDLGNRRTIEVHVR